VIVTDHHEPTSKIPNCVATLNPKRIHSVYPNRDLTGVGVAFKLAHAITNVLIDQGAIDSTRIDLKKYLDLVALGTIADMGALTGENRILVQYGLKQMSKMERIGLRQLFATSEIEQGSFTPNDIASKIAPRLNSLGRISDPIHGVKLLLLNEKLQAEELCKELDINNLNRQRMEREAVIQIEDLLLKSPEIFTERAVVLQSKEWHPGIVAILASRISKQLNRPTLVLSIENGVGKGSLRTTPEFPLLSILKENQDLLLNFGGHDFAAGLTILEENIEAFKKNFIEAAKGCLNEKDMHPKLYLDAQVQFEEINFELIDSLSLLEPFGKENPPPLFYCDVVQTWPPKVIGQDHLKLFFEQNGRELEGMAFGLAHRKNELRGKNIPLKIAFTPYVNTFLNKSSIQLQIKDFQIMTK
jgi:single-stranded-DNA-specific exonuclease